MRNFPLLIKTNRLKLYYFAITLTIPVSTIYSTDSDIIQIEGLIHHENRGNLSHYNISYCNPTIPSAPGGNVRGLTTRGKCANIYPLQNCTGWFIRASLFFQYDYEPKTFQWVGDKLTEADLRIGSVGPCFDRCDPRNWQGDEKHPVEVTLYQENYNSENKTTVVVDGDGCFLIKQKSWYSAAIKISGNASACIELHSGSICAREFTQFRPGYFGLDQLLNWDLGGKDNAVNALAISRCGAFCNKTVPLVNPEVVAGQAKNVVTFYDYSGYYGNHINVNLSGGCVTLENNGNLYESIRTYGQCVVVYGSEGCKETHGYRVLQTEGESKNYYVQKLLTATAPYYLRSAQLCGMGNDEEKADKEARDVCELIESCMTLSSTSVLWGIIMLAFIGLVLISISALGGGVITKLFEKHSHSDNTATLDVVYKSESHNV